MEDTKQKFRDFKDNFQRWYYKKYCTSSLNYKDLMPHHHYEIFEWFNSQDISLQWGIYEDFLELYGIYPQVQDCHGHEVFAIDEVERYHATCCVKGGKYYALCFTNDKKEARIDALEKAVSVFEETEVLN